MRAGSGRERKHWRCSLKKENNFQQDTGFSEGVSPISLSRSESGLCSEDDMTILTKKQKLASVWAFGVVALLSALVVPASANTIYTYTGNPFDAPGSVYNGAQLYATFTMASAQPANSNSSSIPLAFLVSDGFITLTDQSPDTTLVHFGLATDSAGAITGHYWEVDQTRPTPGSLLGFLSSSTGTYAGGYDDAFTFDMQQGRADQIFVYGSGSWTVTSDNAGAGAPEPATFVLFGSALAMAGFARKFLKSQG